MAEKKKAEKETAASTSAFDCLAVTQVTVWPFQEGQNLGHMKGLAQIVLNDQMVVRGLESTGCSWGTRTIRSTRAKIFARSATRLRAS